jgi:SAM-dependent methyltransferase
MTARARRTSCSWCRKSLAFCADRTINVARCNEGLSELGNDPQSVRESYDRIAAAYASHYANELQHKPFDRELLNRFAAEVKGRGDVCEMGCGPGHIARYLWDAGVVSVFGLDLSPRMVEQARQLNPDITFQVGNMMNLDLRDASLGGIVAFYAIVNISEKLLPTVFGEMWRVLKPRGRLLLSFHIGDETVRPGELLGQSVSMDFFFFQPAAITKRIEAAGFAIEDVVERGPYGPEVEYQSRRAYVFAAKAE